jgi:hypothetical protein
MVQEYCTEEAVE